MEKIMEIIDILRIEGENLPEIAIDMVYRILIKFATKQKG